jgi:hypothetical protein
MRLSTSGAVMSLQVRSPSRPVATSSPALVWAGEAPRPIPVSTSSKKLHSSSKKLRRLYT